MLNTNKIVIIGSTHHNTYGAIRCFGEKGISPDLIIIGTSQSYLQYSKYISGIYYAESPSDSLRILEEHFNEAIVFTCTDDVTALLNAGFEKFSKKYYFFNCGHESTLNHYMDKGVQTEIAGEVGFIIPKSYSGFSETIILDDEAFPCIVKPLESIHGGKNIQICETREDYADAVLNKFEKDTPLLVQQFIQKDCEIVVVGASVGEDIIIPAYIYKHRETKGGTTYSTVKPITELPNKLLLQCKAFVRKMNYEGLFGIEFIVKDGEYYFIEMNLRNDATTYSIAVAGYNLPMYYYDSMTSGKFEINKNSIEEIDAIVEFADFINVLKRKVGIWTWIKQLKKSHCKYCYCSADSRVFRIQLKEFVKFLVKRIF